MIVRLGTVISISISIGTTRSFVVSTYIIILLYIYRVPIRFNTVYVVCVYKYLYIYITEVLLCPGILLTLTVFIALFH